MKAFAEDLRACLALRDDRARENREARDRAVANRELRAELEAQAAQGGRVLDWSEYFRAIDINYP